MRQLEYFVRVCEAGSLTKAAELLGVAQPALGLQIKSLEDELGMQLLVRTPRGTVTTDAGEILLEDARVILNRVRELRRKLRDVGTAAKRSIMLGMTPSLTNLLTSRLLGALPKEAPHVKVQILEEFSHSLIERVDRGQLDLALAYSIPADHPLAREPLLREALFFVCCPGSEFDRPGPLPFRDLAMAEYVMPGEGDLVRQRVEETLHRNSLPLNIIYQVQSSQAMKDVIARGMACGVLPYGTIAKELAAKSLVARPIIDPPIVRELFVVWPSGRTLTKDERRVLTIIKGLLRSLLIEIPELAEWHSAA
ncbi:LysR family transcriptional regulator [Bradyrhizobium prioriisuperbiae]|uniref:LysR family transcriptional regulator n=1 Tax=Bradyrhizobium prioriisuperbiae TaxID=2854389 RepID=UPI0028EED430|nr:LysR family transcriptional regulator [Bradyrhizobium prioritasuperba]